MKIMKKRFVLLLGLCVFLASSSISLVSSTDSDSPDIHIQKVIRGYSVCEWINDFLPIWYILPKSLGNSLDNVLPTVTITSPLHNDTVAGMVLITGTAHDSDGEVSHVEVSIDRGPWINATGTTNWTFQWDTTLETNEMHKISAQSYDGADYSNVTSIDVTVDNTQHNTLPVVNITYPSDGDMVVGLTTIMGFAYDSDDDPLNITLRIDDGDWMPVSLLISPPYIGWSYHWNTSLVPDGNHTITVQAHDGHNFTQVSLTVTVSNLNPQVNVLPLVNITSPLDNAFVTGTVTITGTASDIDGVIQKVEIRINDGPWNLAIGTSVWNYNWDTRVHIDSIHTVSARSFDGSNYSETYSITLTVDNTPPATTCSISGTEGINNWWTSNITITLTGMDNTSGIQNTYYKLDNSEWGVYTSSVSLPDEGVHLLLYYSHDVVGNRETNQSLTIKIDKTNPVTTYTLIPDSPTGLNNWYTRSVTLTFLGNDYVSWVNKTCYRINNGTWENYTGPVSLQEDGMHIVDYYSIDNAGNQENLHQVEIKIDKTPPTIRIIKPVTKKLYIFDREIITLPFQTRILGKITLEVFVNDKSSGIQKVQYIIDYGTRIDVSTTPFNYVYDESSLLRHRHVITAKAVDKAGNTSNTDELSIWIFNI